MKIYVYYNLLLLLLALAGIAAYYYYALAFMSWEWTNKLFFIFHEYRVIYMASLGGMLVLNLFWYSYHRRVRRFSGLLLLVISLLTIFYCFYCLYLIPSDIANISTS